MVGVISVDTARVKILRHLEGGGASRFTDVMNMLKCSTRSTMIYLHDLRGHGYIEKPAMEYGILPRGREALRICEVIDRHLDNTSPRTDGKTERGETDG